MSQNKNEMIKKIATMSGLTALACGLLTWLFSSGAAAFSATITHLLLILNMLGIWLIWRVIFQKKSIALGLVVIILKYPLLGFLVIQMSRQSWFNSIGVLIGFLSFVVSLVLVTLIKQTDLQTE